MGNGGSDRLRRWLLLVLALAAVAVLVGVRLAGVGEPQGPSVTTGAGTDAGAEPEPSSTVVPPLPPESDPVPASVLGGLRFVDVTEQAGLAAGPARRLSPDDLDGGAAVADLDDDGDHELLLTSAGPASGLYRNDGGRFTEITGDAGLTRLERATAAVFGDLDADGDLDLFVGGPGTAFGRLLVNDGSGRFADESVARGVVGHPDRDAEHRRVRGADLGDVDLDGDLDLLVTDWNSSAIVAAAVAGSGPTGFETQCEYAAFMQREYRRGGMEPTGDTRLFLNDGRGRFTDGTSAWGLASLGVGLPMTPQLHDLDGDGWLDLVVAGDVCTSRVFRNDGGERFLDHTATSRAATAENGMGSWLRDLDGDARPDWLVTSIGYPTADGSCPQVSLFAGCSGDRAYRNRGDLRFADVTDRLGLRDGWWGWGVVAEDFANDGRVQVAVTNGRPGARGEVDPRDPAEVYYDTFTTDPTRFWVPGGDGGFVEASEAVGLRHTDVAFGLVAFDHDRDGRLDLLVANGGAAPTLYRNVTPRRHWLALRLDDPTSPGNAQALGARVEVTAGGATTTHWVHTSGSYQSQRAAEVHVGLGRRAQPVRVAVWWPDASRPQVVGRVPVDRVVTLTRDTRP